MAFGLNGHFHEINFAPHKVSIGFGHLIVTFCCLFNQDVPLISQDDLED